MNAGTFQYQNKTAHAQKMILRSVAIYGSASDRRYAAVWHANHGFVKWHVHPSDTAADYQVTFNAETQLPGYRLAGYRPAYVALAGDQIYCSVFKDDVVGPWIARHGMTAAAYQAEFNTQNANGFYPICVQGGGSGSQTRYAAIFAQRDIPLVREWTVMGAPVPALAGFDHAMQTFMQANAVRAAQLTVAKNGTVKLARGYTWTEPGYRVTQSTDRFLLASVVVAHVTVMKFFDYVKTALLQPAGISEVLLSPTAASQRPADEAICEDEGLGLSALDPSSPLLVPAVYGGDGQIKEVVAACAGLAASATALTQFIHLHAVWGNGPRAANSARSGSTPGTSSLAVSRGDGIDWPPQGSGPLAARRRNSAVMIDGSCRIAATCSQAHVSTASPGTRFPPQGPLGVSREEQR